MKKLGTVLLGCVLFAAAVSLPTEAKAISVTLDIPDQSVAAPPSGTTTLTFSGSVTIDQFFTAHAPVVDNPTNSTNTFFLTATLDNAFVAFMSAATLGGTYTGDLFTVDVLAGTPEDFYGFFFGTGPSQLRIFESTAGGSRGEASAPFSVTVTDGTNGGPPNAVPENGEALLFLGCSLVGILFARRAFPLHAAR